MARLKNLLVVGGTGFIGRHLAKEGIRRGFVVSILSRKRPLKRNIIKNKKVKYILCDLKNYERLKKKINIKYDYVINASGYGNHPNLNETGKKLFINHFLSLVNLTRVLIKKRPLKFVHFGSSMEYGKQKAPQRENFATRAYTAYGLSKLSCTNFLLNISKQENFPLTILRLFQVYGPKQKEDKIIPYVIKKCLKNEIFTTTKGSQYRDFCHIDDVVKASFQTLQNKKSNGEIINIGSGVPIRIIDLVNKIKKKINKGKHKISKLEKNKNLNMDVVADISKAKKILKWRPKIDLESGLNKIIFFNGKI